MLKKNMKKILTIVTLSLLCVAGVKAQELKKGDITVAVTVGYNQYNDINAFTNSTQPNYEAAAMEALTFNSPLAIGIEGNWFIKKDLALRFGGGLGYSYKPGYNALPGTVNDNLSPDDNLGEIPGYRAVGNASSLRWNIFAGLNKYWALNAVPQLHFFVGGQAGFSYGLNQIKFNEETSMGISVGEGWTARISASVGVDYYVAPSFFIGFEVQPVQYAYNVTGFRPQDGLSVLQGDSHNFALLAAPTLKIGFKF